MKNGATEEPRIAGCDTMVARPEASASGRTVFAKNSDRPPGECQSLTLLESAEHAPGSRVRCQVLEIEQVATTHRVLGSRPHWLWGFEHGVNEHGLAIGNETIFARESPADVGLLGMDLVRLGLERARGVEEALDVLTDLIERHGQGGSGFRDVHWPYNNSFLIADSSDAWILEAVGRHWAARPCGPTDSISNHMAIGQDWERVSHAAKRDAQQRGWWSGQGRLDFAAAYRDRDTVPGVLSEGRLRRSREGLAARRGRVDLAAMRAILRDHAGAGRAIAPGASPEGEDFYTICMHRGPSRTAAGMIVELPAGTTEPLLAWVCPGRPCVSAFVPVFVAGSAVPDVLAAASEGPSEALWWVLEALAARAENDPGLAREIRRRLDLLETDLEREARSAQRELAVVAPGVLPAAAARLAAGWADRFDRTVRAILAS